MVNIHEAIAHGVCDALVVQAPYIKLASRVAPGADWFVMVSDSAGSAIWMCVFRPRIIEVMELFRDHSTELEYADPRVVDQLCDSARGAVAADCAKLLKLWTGLIWVV